MKVLIVEDEQDTLIEIRDHIHSYNKSIEIEGCLNPLIAISLCRQNSFDAAFLDIRMPEMSGLELANCLAVLLPNIMIVFITTYNCYATEAFEINALDYILKPVRQERLYKALDRVFGRFTERRATYRESPNAVTVQAFRKVVIASRGIIMKWKRQKSSELFAYLLHNLGTPVHKEKLCEIMWPECAPQKSLTYLQTIMYQLRKGVAEIAYGQISIEYADQCYCLIMNDVQYDVVRFTNAFEHAFCSNPVCLERLMEAERLYTGNYLEEEGWIWSFGRRQDLQKKYQMILETIINIHMNCCNKQEVLHYIRKWYSLDIYHFNNKYITWIEENIGKEEAERIISLD